MAKKKTTNSATVWTGAVAWFNEQPKTELVNTKNMSEWGMSFASDYSRDLLNWGNGYSSPASDYSKDLLNGWNWYSSPMSDYSRSLLNWGNNTSNTNNINNTNWWLTNKNTSRSTSTTTNNSTNTITTNQEQPEVESEYDKRKWMLDDWLASGKITQEQYNDTLNLVESKFGNWTTTPTGTTTPTDVTTPTGTETNTDYSDSTPGYFRDAEGNEIKIYGYQALSDDMKKYVDQMSDAEKKKISNMWAQALQNYIKQYADSNYEKDYREKMYGLAQDMRDIQTQQEAIQYGQQLRQAEEQVNNLMQNWEYLWNMGMPGLSKTKLQAISDSIKEANTSLDELVRLQWLAKEASAKNWEIDVAQYEKQISDIVRDLNYKIPQEIQNALNKYTVAELEGNLDTIDWVVAFKKSLLDDLDNNISGLTSASLQQMQYITDNYMQMADKAYEEAKLYQQNANTVNSEMSSIRWYYIDGNGNPILDSQWLPIKVPQSAPMDPVFDKESGKLIQFYYNDDGSIGASVQQLYDGDQSSTQSTIVSLLEQWFSTQDILKYVPGADLKTVQELAKVVNVQYRTDGLSRVYNGKEYTPTTQAQVDSVLSRLNKWGWWGQCGYFVNNYLQDLGVWRLYSDPITDKTKNINSKEAKVWNVVVMDSPTHPEYWHVWIITAIDGDWNMTILQSNKNDNEQIYTSKKNINDDGIYGYFDPRKSIDEYNAESAALTSSNWLPEFENGFDPVKTWYYQKYLDWKMVSTDWAQMGNNFMDELHNYQKYINSQVPEEAQKLLDIISDLKKMSRGDYNKAAAWKLLPRTSGYAYYKKFQQFIASASLNNLIDMKKQWATFGALSDNELWFITNAATDLDFGLKYRDFMKELDYYETQLKSKLGRYNTEGNENYGSVWNDRSI